MDWKLSDLASAAEIVAAVGVIVSLIFVGFQVRDGNQETRAATIQAALDSELFFIATITDHAETWDKVAAISRSSFTNCRRYPWALAS